MPKSKNPNKRSWEPQEQRLCSEILVKFYGDWPSKTHVHLGATPLRVGGQFISESERRLVGVFRRWADGMVFMPDRLVLIEVKKLPQPGVVGQMEYYAELVGKTPELEEHWHKPLEMHLWCAIEDPQVTLFARKRNVKVSVYCPEWMAKHLEKLHPWERTPQPAWTTKPPTEKA